jgi:hypothetical protein
MPAAAGMPARAAVSSTHSRIRIMAATLSLAAGAIHLLAAPSHLDEWWGYGSFFLTAAAAQALFGLLLLGQPWRYDEAGIYDPARNAPLERLLLVAAAVLTAAVVVLYVVTRTVGIPLLGPQAGVVEPLDGAGLAATAIEVAQIACLIALLRSGS